MTEANIATIVVETAKLEGSALDWAVAKADGTAQMFDTDNDWPGNSAVTQASIVGSVVILALDGRLYVESDLKSKPWAPSIDWSQAGALLDTHIKRLGNCAQPVNGWDDIPEGKQCFAIAHSDDFATGPTKCIAVCRAVVLAKLGSAVEVPARLVTV